MDTNCKDTIEIPGYGWFPLTPWVRSSEANPTKPGIYISSVSTRQIFYRYWDGDNWYYGGSTAGIAESNKNTQWPWPHTLFWRGLAEEPVKLPF